jgi:hypothetical protein
VLRAHLAAAAILALPGCDGLLGLGRVGPVAGVDAAVLDTQPPPIDARICVGRNGAEDSGLYSICRDEVSVASRLSPSVTILDTSTGCPNLIDGVCVFAYESVHVTGTVRAVGSRPLVLVSFGDLIVDDQAVIDGGSRPGSRGPAGGLMGCSPPSTPGPGGGGGGGSFQTSGGRGGAATGGSVSSAGALIEFPSTLRGGCDGRGGGANSGVSGGTRGFGGGALYLVAAGTIEVRGKIDASGGGGVGGRASGEPEAGGSGGGGGGSGGLIGLDAPMIVLASSSTLMANGGGGGGGGGCCSNGASGSQPEQPLESPLGGAGGLGSPAGAAGGRGWTRTVEAFDGSASPDDGGAGGGGGGGGGYIAIFAHTATVAGIASPDIVGF